MRLNLGAADVRIDGWTSVDLGAADIAHDLSVFPWPFADGSAEAILASHVLEHLTLADARRFLAECARVLRPGGTLSIAVPDMDRFIEAWRTGDFSPLAGYRWQSLNTFMGGGREEPRAAWRHQHMWNWSALAWELQRVGLVPERVTFDTAAAGDVHTPQYRAISLYVDGHKGAAE
jgi:SAM-dependent methyltransferase